MKTASAVSESGMRSVQSSCESFVLNSSLCSSTSDFGKRIEGGERQHQETNVGRERAGDREVETGDEHGGEFFAAGKRAEHARELQAKHAVAEKEVSALAR